MCAHAKEETIRAVVILADHVSLYRVGSNSETKLRPDILTSWFERRADLASVVSSYFEITVQESL